MTDVIGTPAQRPSESSLASSSDSLLMRMLLQQHQSIISNLLIRSILGRLVSIGIALYVTLPGELSLTQVVGAATSAIVVAGTWMSEIARWTRQLAGLEETLGRNAARETEQLYIASRYFLFRRSRGRFGASLSHYEPTVWLVINWGLIALAATVGGIAV